MSTGLSGGGHFPNWGLLFPNGSSQYQVNITLHSRLLSSCHVVSEHGPSLAITGPHSLPYIYPLPRGHWGGWRKSQDGKCIGYLAITASKNGIHSQDRLRCGGDGSSGLDSFLRRVHALMHTIPPSPGPDLEMGSLVKLLREGSQIRSSWII